MEEYTVRSDLLDEEKEALRNYQDIGNRQHTWSCFIPESEEHHDCYVINRALRDACYLNTLSDTDRKQFWETVGYLDSALEKSSVPSGTRLIKGLDTIDWLWNKKENDTYVDNGYGSFSLSLNKAKGYAKIQDTGARVILLFQTRSELHGSYLDSQEEEVLLPRGIQYSILRITRYSLGVLFEDSEAIVYIVGEA